MAAAGLFFAAGISSVHFSSFVTRLEMMKLEVKLQS
jgi:hypothetical protein